MVGWTMTAEHDQLTRIHAHARVIWGRGDYNISVNQRLATLSRDGVALSQIRSCSWEGTALDGLERALRQRVADLS